MFHIARAPFTSKKFMFGKVLRTLNCFVCSLRLRAQRVTQGLFKKDWHIRPRAQDPSRGYAGYGICQSH